MKIKDSSEGGNTPNPIKGYQSQIRETKKEMKRRGIRITSCFNGGLTADELRFNQELFRLKTELARLS